MTAVSRKGVSDRRILLILGGTMVFLLVGISLIAGNSADNDPRPTTYNTAAEGAAALYQTLEGLHRPVARWEKPLAQLNQLDDRAAERTTLVLAEPVFPPSSIREEAADLRRFLERGGHVLLTGSRWATVLPEGRTGPPSFFQGKVCYTSPEGPGELAAAGEVEMADAGSWTATGPQFRVEQRCNNDAVVVRFPVGKGEAVWWSSSTPLSNAGLKREPNLKLLLTSLYGSGGEARDVLFDEYVQELHGDDRDLTKGLPLRWLGIQLAAVFLLLVLSFSRRKGPVRMPAELPRSSPVEFAASMGDLYAKGGATDAAVDAARRRLMRLMTREAGIARGAIEAGPDAIAAALRTRLGGDWASLAKHLHDATDESRGTLDTRSALALVRALGEDEDRIHAALHTAANAASTSGTSPRQRQ